MSIARGERVTQIDDAKDRQTVFPARRLDAARRLGLAATLEVTGTSRRRRRRKRVLQPAKPWQPWKSFGLLGGAVLAAVTVATMSIVRVFVIVPTLSMLSLAPSSPAVPDPPDHATASVTAYRSAPTFFCTTSSHLLRSRCREWISNCLRRAARNWVCLTDDEPAQ